MAGEVECCLFCGRDTWDRSRICDRCLNGEQEPIERLEDHCGCLPAEDDYSEESGPDSVCEDHSDMDGFADLNRCMNGQTRSPCHCGTCVGRRPRRRRAS